MLCVHALGRMDLGVTMTLLAATEHVSEIDILHVVVHDLIKARSGKASVDLATSELEVSPLVKFVVDTLAKEYRTRASKSHGSFVDDPDNAPVPVHIREYAIAQTLSFLDLTHALMGTLRDRAGQQSGATGGHVLIAHVRQENHDEGLLIAILTEEVGAAITKSKGMEESRYLNMKGFRFAGRVDLTGLLANAERYVSFLRGSTKDVSDYFKLFLGCDTTIQALKETIKLNGAILAFAHEHLSNELERTTFLRDANDACLALAKAGEMFEPAPFANRLWPSKPEMLVEALESPAVGLSAGFVPHKRGLRGLVKFSGSKPGRWKVEFEREALTSGDIVYDASQSTLTIKTLPPDLLARLREEFED